MTKTIVAGVQELLAYTIVVAWEERSIIHRAWTRTDALAWAACYPYEAAVTVHKGLWPRVVARRMGA